MGWRSTSVVFLVSLLLTSCGAAGSGTAVGDGNETRSNMARSRYRHYLAVTVAPGGTLYAVGHNGTIARHQPGTPEWTLLSGGTEHSLFDASFPTPREGWVVGAVGVILHTPDGGASWIAQASGTEKELLAVSFVSATRGWVVGAAGTMLETRDGGQSWHDRSLSADVNLNDVFFLDAHTGWVVGEYGAVLKTTDGGATWEQIAGNIPDMGTEGLSWEELMSNPEIGAGGGSLATRGGLGENDNLFAVYFADAQRGWATATGGRVFVTQDGGANWTARETGVETPLFAVRTACPTCPLYACGGKGMVLRSMDGGDTWVTVPLAEPVYAYLRDLTLLPDGNLVIVGTNGTLVNAPQAG